MTVAVPRRRLATFPTALEAVPPLGWARIGSACRCGRPGSPAGEPPQPGVRRYRRLAAVAFHRVAMGCARVFVLSVGS